MKPVVWLAVLLGLAACEAGGASPPQSVTERSTYTACRQQANTAYRLQNRDQIYRIQDPFTPQSSTGLTENPSQGLADSFSQQQMVNDCIRNTGTQTSRGGTSPGPVNLVGGTGGGAAATGGTGAYPGAGSVSR